MPCIRIKDGFLCGNHPVTEIRHKGRTWRFEKNGAGFYPVKANGMGGDSQRVPVAVLEKLEKETNYGLLQRNQNP